jgi:hypothetical protein
MKKHKLASIAFPLPKLEDVDRLVTHALDHHVGRYEMLGWEVSFGLLDPMALKAIRDMMESGEHEQAAALSLYCGSIPAEEWLFGEGYRISARKLTDPVLGEAYLFTWE